MYFERQVRRTRPIPLTSLIDVMFFLLLFFMLSTSFVRTESLELTLPGNAPITTPQPQEKTLQIYLTKDGIMYMDDQQIGLDSLTRTLRETFMRQPDQGVLLLNGPEVSVQQMINVMDKIYLSGGKNLSVESWNPAPSADTRKKEQQ